MANVYIINENLVLGTWSIDQGRNEKSCVQVILSSYKMILFTPKGVCIIYINKIVEITPSVGNSKVWEPIY